MLYYAPNDPNLGGGSVTEVNISSGYPSVDPNAQYLVTGLDYNQLYHWRVDEIRGGDPCATSVGMVWNFTTKGEYPEITLQPLDVTAADSCSVQFSVEVQSATTPHYTWKKSLDAQVGGDTTVGTDSDVLTVVVSSSTEAFYYCIVTNEGSAGTDTSDVVGLWREKEVARWKLNNDLTDDTGNGWTAQWDGTGDPCVAYQVFDPCAVEGSHSVLFHDDPNNFLSVSGSEDYFNHYIRGLTVNCWVKVESGATGWEAVVSKQARTTSPGTDGWTIELNSGVPTFTVRGAAGALTGPSVADSDWHMLTGIFDYDGEVVALYVDGEREAYDDTIAPDGPVKTPSVPFAIAAGDANDGAGAGDVLPFGGMIDDVRIWTYPQSSLDIAMLYIDTYGDYHSKGAICIDNVKPIYDFNQDCDTDFADLAIFAATWLDCNIYPASGCGN
jgi:hypothetical protein